jgi:hypothetical protein
LLSGLLVALLLAALSWLLLLLLTRLLILLAALALLTALVWIAHVVSSIGVRVTQQETIGRNARSTFSRTIFAVMG